VSRGVAAASASYLHAREPSWPLALGVFLIFYGVGVVGHLIEPLRPLMLAITPWFLPLMGVLSLAFLFLMGHRTLWLWLVGTVGLTWLIEVLGVHTGLVFGSNTCTGAGSGHRSSAYRP
jgi:hypothetical protein